MVWLLAVKPAHPDLSSRLGIGDCIFLDLFHYLTGVILSVADDVLVDYEAPMVTLSIFRICRFSLSEVRVRVFIDEYTCV